MTDLDRTLLRALAEWDPGSVPVTSVYLTVDGRRHPRRSDYEVRLDELLRSARAQAEGLEGEAIGSVERDLERMSGFVRGDFERGETRGLALFSAGAADLWEAVRVPRPVRDRAAVGPEADLLPLEALLEAYATACTTLVDFEKARLFLLHLGQIHEVRDVWDEVPNRHDQGGWAQMRMQRHVDDHRQKHLKNVADALFQLWQGRRFEHLILAGPGEAHRELDAELHEYLRRLVRGRVVLPMTASADEVRAHSVEVVERLDRESETERVARVAAAAGSGAGGTVGLEATLQARSEGRVGELVVDVDQRAPGAVCDACGRLTTASGECPACGAQVREVADVIESAVALAFRQGSRVETVVADVRLHDLGGIGALLRY
jgi:peptide subunit release factor 1 (eRF1)